MDPQTFVELRFNTPVPSFSARRTHGREGLLMHVLEVLDDDLGVEFATVAVVAIIAMSVRILFASHVRCWTCWDAFGVLAGGCEWFVRDTRRGLRC